MVAKGSSSRSRNRQLPSSAPHRRKSHRVVWSIFFIALIAIATIILINVFQPLHSENTQPTDNTTSESSSTTDVKGDSKSSDNSSNDSKDLDPLIKDKTPTQHEGASANASDSLTGSISYTDISSDKLTVRINIDQFLEDGTCVLHLLQDQNDYFFEANITLSASTSTCRGFDIDTTGLPSGNYDLRIDLSSGDKTGIINGKVTL